MANRVLREACVHGRYEEHSVMWTDNRTPSSYTSPCPGGREVTATPMYRQGGISGAWYSMPPDDEDEPDGYLILSGEV